MTYPMVQRVDTKCDCHKNPIPEKSCMKEVRRFIRIKDLKLLHCIIRRKVKILFPLSISLLKYMILLT